MFIYLSTDWFNYLFFIYFNNNKTEGASFLIFCLTNSVHVSTVSLLVRLFVSMYFSSFSMLSTKTFVSFCVSEPFCLFVCLFGYYPALVIIFPKSLYCYCQFWFCATTVISINRHPSFFISFLIRPLGENSRHSLRAAWPTLTHPLYG